GYTAQSDVGYTKGEGWDCRMDLYLAPKTEGAAPVIIYILCRGGNKGVNVSQTGLKNLLTIGYALANAEYHLADQGSAAAAVEDVRCALIYLIKHAKELNIDTSKIVVMGGSAGGHLALMAGMLANDHRFDKNCQGVENIKVAAIIDKYG